MKIKNNITAVLLLMCILLTPALASSASAHAYDHVYNDVTVITPDSLEDVFGETEVERAAYTYEMVVINAVKASIVINFEIKVGNNYYTGDANGQIKAYNLPSGEIVWEGPVNGGITVGNDVYSIVVGFTKLNSTDQSMLTITTKSAENQLVAFAFGEDIIKGETLELINNRTIRQSGANSTNNIEIDDMEYIFNEEVSPLVIEPGFGPGISPIFKPGDGVPDYPNLGPNGEIVYQDYHISYFGDTLYPSQEIRIYEDENRNFVLVTFIPDTASARSYLSGMGYNYSAAVLDSFSVRIDLDPNAPPSQYAYVAGTYIPQIDDAPTFEKGDEYFSSIFEDLLSMIDYFPTSTVMTLISDMKGSISGKRSTFYAQVDVDMSVNPADMDEVSCGFPVRFNLFQGTNSNYISNTEYTITSYVTYLLIGTSTNGETNSPIYSNFYVSDLCTCNGVINLC